MAQLLPPIDPKNLHVGCLNCSTARLEAPMDMPICVGFGDARVTRDGETIHDGERAWEDGHEPWTVQDAENAAAADPDHDWRIVKYSPMHGETFQRHAPGKWVCVESNEGFA
jgi:hypothetical protein